ncbi:hypothetical protein DNTS_022258, partial [Danionella cerebrum]
MESRATGNMLRILLLSVLAALALAEPRYLEDQSIEERVVGGEVAKPNSWPWQISLQYLSGGSYYHTCGGTLIKKGWVLTAAHCVDTSRTWRVVLGDHDIYNHEGREQYMTVSRVYVHPNWNTNNVAAGYDIALLRLTSDATLNSYVQLAALPPSGQVLPHNNPCYISGWGRTQTGGSLSAQLKQAYLPVVDYNTCTRNDWWGSTAKNTMGDSGGPLNCQVSGQYVVHGVTSFVSSSGCNAYQKPTVFTRVSAYSSWISGWRLSPGTGRIWPLRRGLSVERWRDRTLGPGRWAIWRVVLGDHDLTVEEGTEQAIPVDEVTFHAFFNPNNFAAGYDIAILSLSHDAILNSYVQLIPLPPNGQVLPHNNPCYVTGWGVTKAGGDTANALLKQALLPAVDYETCSQSDWWGSSMTEALICGGDGSEAGCKGDTGGPLSCLVDGKYVVSGILSFNSEEGCGVYKKPTVFTRVAYHVNWLIT